MKVYISVDIEGVAGITHWDEAEIGKEGYQEYREQMTVEAVAACEGALDAGATEILVKDAHWSARNIYPERLPEEARLIRGWNGEPFAMIQGLDSSFDAAAMIGYHSGAGAGGNPLAHTMTEVDTKTLINGELTSEYLLHRNAAAMRGVPVVFLSGDKNLCDTAMATNRVVHTVATKEGAGASTTSLQPMAAAKQIRAGMAAALRDEAARELPTLAEHFAVEVWFGKNEDAYQASYFPGARLIDPHCVAMETDDYYEVGRILHFIL
jgi:D-amino peptidase